MGHAIETSRADRLAGIGIVLAAVYALAMLNYWVPVLRFSAPLLNTLFLSLIQGIPMALLAFALLAGPWWSRILWCIAEASG